MCVECVWKDGERTVSRAKSGETLVEATDTSAQVVRYFFHGSERQIEPSHGWFPPTLVTFGELVGPSDNPTWAVLGKQNWR